MKAELQLIYLESSPEEIQPIREVICFETKIIAGLSVEHSIPSKKLCSIPILFVHGMWCHGRMFRPLMLKFGDLGYECYALNLRGHEVGFPTEKIGKISIADHISDVKRVLVELGESVILIGHSMGEIIAAKVAERNPEFVAAQIGMTSAPPRWVFMGMKAVFRLPKYLWKVCMRQPILPSISDSMFLFFNRLHPIMAEHLAKNLRPESGLVAWEIMTWKYKLARLLCPFLLIGAVFDNITPHQRLLAKRLGADYATIPCGHMVMNDPSLIFVVRIIHRWLEQKLEQAYA